MSCWRVVQGSWRSIHYFITVCCLLVIGATQIQSVYVSNPLDIGSVSNCVSVESSICSSLDYLVPEPAASVSNISDAHISDIINRLSQAHSPECIDIIQESLCNQRYPICNQQYQTVSAPVPENCSDRIMVSCTSRADLFIEAYCTFETSNVSLSQCKTIEQIASEKQHVFKYCNNTMQDYVTEWMFQNLVQIDQEVEEFLERADPADDSCSDDYINFMCGSIGRCWDNGNRVELTQNQTNCFMARRSGCFNSRAILIPEEVCNAWPEEAQLSTIATPLTDNTPPIELTINPTNSFTDTPPMESATIASSSVVDSTPFGLPTVLPSSSITVQLPNSAQSVSFSLLLICMSTILVHCILRL